MALIVVGVDPGITGALAQFVGGELRDIRDMPINTTEKASKGASIRDLIGGSKSHKRAEIDKGALAALLREWTGNFSARVVCEAVHTMPKQGIVSSGKLMHTLGIIEGITIALGIELMKVDPEKWKRLTGTPADKNLARARATQAFPEWTSHFNRVKDHNRAEACLIGLYGVHHAAQN